jgi:hypothetical protein
MRGFRPRSIRATQVRKTSAALVILDLLVASAAMTLSSVFVVRNSLRLGRFRVRGAAPGRGRPRSFPAMAFKQAQTVAILDADRVRRRRAE